MPLRRRYASRRRTRSRRILRGSRRTRRTRPRTTRSFAARRTSRRRILNMTSVKKRDNMLPMVAAAGATRPELGPITTSAGFTSLFVPTARYLAPGVDQGMSMRQRQTTFAVGYKERLQIDVSGGGVWKWRRIVFAYKGGDSLWAGSFPGEWTEPFYSKAFKREPGDPTPLAPDMVRLIAQPTKDQAIAIRQLIWDGAEGVDWSSEFTAKIDTKRVRLLSDKTYTFNPGNESGISRTYNLWYPLRKNVVYDEPEYGGISFGGGSPISVQSKLGLGDVYVYDIVENTVQSKDKTGGLRFSPEGTYYWHER